MCFLRNLYYRERVDRCRPGSGNDVAGWFDGFVCLLSGGHACGSASCSDIAFGGCSLRWWSFVLYNYVITLHGIIILLMSLRPGRRKNVLEGWVAAKAVYNNRKIEFAGAVG